MNHCKQSKLVSLKPTAGVDLSQIAYVSGRVLLPYLMAGLAVLALH